MFAGMAYAREVSDVKAEKIATYDCEGNACPLLTLIWENQEQRFRVQNDADRPVKVEVTTFAGLSSIRVDAHKSDYLLVKYFNGPYRANYD